MKLFRAMATVGGMTMLSRVAGFTRDILTAALLGAGPVADAFFVALKLPNLFRRVTAEGAFSVSFVPMYSGRRETKGAGAADEFANDALAIMLAILVPFTILAVLAMPFIIYGIAPGFADEPERYDLAVTLSRITFPYLALISVVALIGGILNSVDRFAPFAAAPVFFNLCLIGALLGLTPVLETPGHAMAWGVAVSGFVQLGWMLWSLKRAGMRLRLRLPRITPDIKQLFRLMGPGVLGAGVVQINLFIDVILASLLPAGAISYLYYADRLNQLPLGVIGIAVGTALLPMLSRAVSTGDDKHATDLFSRAMEISLLLAVPAAVALAAMPGPILSVLFERGAFGADQTHSTAMALAAYSLGLPAYVVVKVLNTAYYSREDTKSPVKAAIVATICNSCLSLALIWPLQHVGIALATGITAWLHMGLMARWLMRDGHLQLDDRFKSRAPRILASAAGMGLALLLANHFLGYGFDGGTGQRVVWLGMFVGGGMAVYALLVVLSGATRPGDLRAAFRRPRKA